MLRKNDWHEIVRQPVVNHGRNNDRSGRPDKNRDHELKRGPTGRRSNARKLGCISRRDAAEVYSPEVHRHADQSNV